MNPSVRTIRIPQADPSPARTLMSGMSPQGHSLVVTNRCIVRDGKPWLPVMGEFHFSRYPYAQWEEELLKMKAGGIDVIATYIFWIHVEEVEGQFNWSGDRDLRRFIELCASLGLYAYPRIGPWAHGECRNGGFPDWLLEKCGEQVRKDAPLYLSFVRRFYSEIAHQLQGLLWKDGGPIIGIQIENELYDNAAHISTLKHLAQDLGMDVPLYTMTGWGQAEIPAGEVVPVFGGYPDAFWDRQIETWSRPSRKHFFFSHLRDDSTIGADLHARQDITDSRHLEEYPYGTCETGGGMQVSYHRRPRIFPQDVAAIGMVKIANGSNLLGYYMAHGGANPLDSKTPLQESQQTGYPNDLPQINYDFQAPLGQYGQVRESYHAMRPLHLFLQDYGDRLCLLPMNLPDQAPSSIDDRTTLRWAVRSDGLRGFVFLNNYQRIETLAEHSGVQFQVHLPASRLCFPSAPVTIASGLTAIWPFHFDLGGSLDLAWASAQPICHLNWMGAPLHVFFASPGIAPEFAFEKLQVARIESPGSLVDSGDCWIVQGLQPGLTCLLTVSTHTGEIVRILVITEAQSRQLWKAHIWGEERIFLSENVLLFEEDRLRIQSIQRMDGPADGVSIFPFDFAVAPAPAALSLCDGSAASPLVQQADGIFIRCTSSRSVPSLRPETRRVKAAGKTHPVHIGHARVAQPPEDKAFDRAETWQVEVPINPNLHECFLTIDFLGDIARAYIAKRLVDDDFYHGVPWQIGLRRFSTAAPVHTLTLKFLPLRADAPIYLPEESRPDFSGQIDVVQVNSLALHGVIEISVKAEAAVRV